MTKRKYIKRMANFAVIISALSHIFCCGIPAFLAIVGLGGALGVYGINATGFEFIHLWEEELLVFSGLVLIVTAVVQGISQHIDCHRFGCTHKPCAEKKGWSLWIFLVALTLFIINFLIYLLYPHIH